jgi:Domain of unknown function (DUF4845)
LNIAPTALRIRRASHERGIAIVSLVVLVILIGFVAIVVLRVVPTVVEYRAAVSAVKRAQTTANTVVEIQKAFDRSATIEDITAISGKDLDITKVNDEIVVSFAYTKKIPLFGPVSLTIDYAGSSKAL